MELKQYKHENSKQRQFISSIFGVINNSTSIILSQLSDCERMKR